MSGKNDKNGDRHLELMEVARRLLIRRGLGELNIDQVSKLSGYSRPTVYLHFECKQALLDSLALRNLEVTRELIQKGADFEGTTRERAFAQILAYEVLARFHTDEFHVLEFLGMPWIRGHLPEKIDRQYVALVKFFSGNLALFVKQAIASGDLVLRPNMTVGNIVFHSISMSYGIFSSIVKERVILSLSGAINPWDEARTSLQCFWDGLGWSGTSDVIDYAKVGDRFLKDYFPDQWVQLELERIKRDAGFGDGI